MRPFVCCLLALLAFGVAPASAADLSKIERAIAKEPAYQTKSPKYCLLVFGEEAKQRVWLVLDGNVLYVDRNGNGDLTEAGKRVSATVTGKFFRAGELFDGKYIHLDLRQNAGGLDIVVWLPLPGGAHRRLFAGFDGPGELQFAERIAKAPIIHFDGPLSLRLMTPSATLDPGKENRLNFIVGTPGLGQGTFAKFGLARREKFEASAEVEFADQKKMKLTFPVEGEG